MAGGHVWHWGHVWSGGGVHASQVACVMGGMCSGVACMAGGMCDGGLVWWGGMHAMHAPPWQILQDTVNEWAVRILLECILVLFYNCTEERYCN